MLTSGVLVGTGGVSGKVASAGGREVPALLLGTAEDVEGTGRSGW